MSAYTTESLARQDDLGTYIDAGALPAVAIFVGLSPVSAK